MIDECVKCGIEDDDRKGNQLVVDADGVAGIISGTETEQVFPVRTEAWDPGNVYVVKYSNISDARPAYLRALNGWLDYLKSGNSQYVDYTDSENEDELVTMIKEYYA